MCNNTCQHLSGYARLQMYKGEQVNKQSSTWCSTQMRLHPLYICITFSDSDGMQDICHHHSSITTRMGLRSFILVSVGLILSAIQWTRQDNALALSCHLTGICHLLLKTKQYFLFLFNPIIRRLYFSISVVAKYSLETNAYSNCDNSIQLLILVHSVGYYYYYSFTLLLKQYNRYFVFTAQAYT